jgi:hypothetical protein
MNWKQGIGVVCLILACVFTLSSMSLIAREWNKVTDSSGYGVGYAVGACLPPLILLILGLWLVQKSSPRGRNRIRDYDYDDDDRDDPDDRDYYRRRGERRPEDRDRYRG